MELIERGGLFGRYTPATESRESQGAKEERGRGKGRTGNEGTEIKGVQRATALESSRIGRLSERENGPASNGV